MAFGLVSQGARKLILIMPYFGYSTMERAVKKGEVVVAKSRATLFSSIPSCPEGNHVALIDLHSEGIPYYFERHFLPTHIHATTLILEATREIGGPEFVMACVDAGRAKWVESLANSLGVSAAFVFKKRLSAIETVITGVSATVQKLKVIIYDDMVRTGGSVLQAAKAYRDAGASEVHLLTTHGLFVNDSLQTLRNSGLIESVVCTDSHSRALQLEESPFFKVKSIAPIIQEYLKSVID
jgi:ribose-phosphate pyrophosphokinase